MSRFQCLFCAAVWICFTALSVFFGWVLFGSASAHADVYITVQDAPRTTACPVPEPTMEKQKDGSYMRRQSNAVNAVNCMTQPSAHQEKWTDYPENGGMQLIPCLPNIGWNGCVIGNVHK